MTLLDSVDIFFGKTKRSLELYQGDLTNLSPSDAVDYLVVSSLPKDYSPVSGSLIGALYNKGVSVAKLATNKAADYEPKMPCWVSQQITSTNPGIQFKRILLFEPSNPATEAVNYIKDIFKGINCMQGSKATTVALPLVSTGSGGATDTAILTALFFAAAHWQAQAFPLNTVKITIYNKSKATALKTVFGTLKNNYNNLTTLSLPGSYSIYAKQAWNKVKNMTLPSYLTKRQAFGISVYTSNYYGKINSVLRSQKWSDSDYQKLLPLFESIDSGLANIPPYTKEVYRGEGNMSPARLAKYIPGADITQLAYTSTAYAKGSWYNNKFQFDIKSIKGSIIENYSLYPGEKEVLFQRLFIEHINTKTANSKGGYLFNINEKVIDYCH